MVRCSVRVTGVFSCRASLSCLVSAKENFMFGMFERGFHPEAGFPLAFYFDFVGCGNFE